MKHIEVMPYVTSCVAFVNAIIMSTDEFQDRVKIRNEFVGECIVSKDDIVLYMLLFQTFVREMSMYQFST